MIKIKSPEQIEVMKAAGRLSACALRVVGEHIHPGITTYELDQIAEETIRSAGGVPAFKGYEGFPATICISVNNMVVHGIPSKNFVLADGDVVSVDTGAIVDGWVGDNAQTFACGRIAPELRQLLDAGEEAMWAGVEQAKIGNHMGDIGFAIEQSAKQNGYKVVKQYVGHGVGRDMHEDPIVPNYGKPGEGIELLEGMVLAIEPMLNMKSAKVKVSHDGWGVKTRDGLPSCHFERTVAITASGPVVLTQE